MNTKLKDAYEAAIQTQTHQRKQAITPFARKVSASIFAAGLLAIEDHRENVAQYRVVSAPTGSGKSSYAQALTKAYIEVVPEASVLYLVQTRQQAEDIYRDMSDLIGRDHVAVWSVAHDVGTSPEAAIRDSGFKPCRHFSVDDLCNYPVVITTQGFYTGPRASKASMYASKHRQITFIDERPNAVSIFDVDTGLIKLVRDRLAQEHTSASEAVTRLTELHDNLERVWQSASRKSAFDVLPSTADLDVSWFASPHTAKYIASPDEQVKSVFGFCRALANGYAFLARYDSKGNGARFIGYDMNMSPRPGMIILDATADIDGLSLIAKNRNSVGVPQVNFGNLTVTHIDPEPLRLAGKKTHRKISEVVTKAEWAQPYADWILDTIKIHTQPGEQVLVVAHKGLLDHRYLPTQSDFSCPFDLEGRGVCFTHWGTGIGSNRWKDASAVFLFGEFHKPRRTMVAAGLGWGEKQATQTSLLPYQAWNKKDGPLLALKDGDLCRWMKQMAMRGNARNIDADGVCGVQRLYVTGELDRLNCYTELMFPGATLIVNHPQKRFQHGGTEALVALLFQSQADFLTTAEVKRLTGVDLQKNRTRYVSKPEVQAAMKRNNWDFLTGSGRGNMGGFVRVPLSELSEQGLSVIPSFDTALPSFEDVSG